MLLKWYIFDWLLHIYYTDRNRPQRPSDVWAYLWRYVTTRYNELKKQGIARFRVPITIIEILNIACLVRCEQESRESAETWERESRAQGDSKSNAWQWWSGAIKQKQTVGWQIKREMKWSGRGIEVRKWTVKRRIDIVYCPDTETESENQMDERSNEVQNR